MMRTNILLPTSANAAFANASSPKYSIRKGKHDNPGAKDGNNRRILRKTAESLDTFMIVTTKYAPSIIKTLRRRVIKGNNKSSLSISIFSSAMNIVAGKAKFSMIDFMPLVSSGDEIFFCKKNPTTISETNTRVL